MKEGRAEKADNSRRDTSRDFLEECLSFEEALELLARLMIRFDSEREKGDEGSR
jgi:hypothetical protein